LPFLSLHCHSCHSCLHHCTIASRSTTDCEKGNIREHCDYVGFERSVDRHTPEKLNFREIETIGPLSKKLGVSVDYTYSDESINELAAEILKYLQTGEMCGKVALVVWKHSRLGHLAHHLGCGPMQGCPVDYPGRTFDEIWQLKFVYRAHEYATTKSLKHTEKSQWHVYGSVQEERFDPLAFSKLVGDYSKHKQHRHHHGDYPREANWEESAIKVPERRRPSDRTEWEALKLGMWPGQLSDLRGDDRV
jgi:hypothetical protein